VHLHVPLQVVGLSRVGAWVSKAGVPLLSLSLSGRVEVGRGGPCLNFINERRELYMYKPNCKISATGKHKDG